MSLAFGVISKSKLGTGFVLTVTGITDNGTADIAEARQEDGTMKERRAYSKRNTITITGYYETGEEPPEAGDIFIYNEVNYLIESSDKTESNTEYVTVSLTASRVDAENQVAYVAPTP